MTDAPRSLSMRLEHWATVAENLSLVLLLGTMMVLAVGQIALRVFFSTGFVWADELVKLIVLWVALVASIAAARSDRHLRIDILTHFVAERYARLPRILADAFASFVCGVVAWQAFRYVALSYAFGDTILVDVPAWLAQAMLPLAFALMCYRFLLAAVNNILTMLRPVVGSPGAP